MNQKQAEQLIELATIANNAGLQAIDTLATAIEQFSKAKSLCNNLRWRIMPVTQSQIQAAAPSKPTKQVHKETGAEGIVYPFIRDTLYNHAHAARYLNTNAHKIIEAVDAGKLYSVHIYGSELIPQKSLDIYRETFKKS